MWLISRSSLEEHTFVPFAEYLRHWLDRHQAEAVLVRPDRYVFGTGAANDLRQQWSAAHSLLSRK
jgi:3-(3-hydroxy-phenyl)propionate hydroxylase